MSSRNEPAMSAKILNKAGWMLSDQTGRVKSFKLRAGRICVHVGMLLATCKGKLAPPGTLALLLNFLACLESLG
ncbi:hypothetical protein HanPI659440_Chr13g0504191 [Helianthus annuus]|nr:hypothetical protein HanPI659440_Chr13g0504191 [Helianthus annuus]